MTDTELAKWVREELRSIDRRWSGVGCIEPPDVGALIQATTALVGLLREAAQRLDKLLDERAVLGIARLDDDTFTARLRAVLGEGR